MRRVPPAEEPVDDMIDFAGKVLAYTDGLDQAGFVASRLTWLMCASWPRPKLNCKLVRPRRTAEERARG